MVHIILLYCLNSPRILFHSFGKGRGKKHSTFGCSAYRSRSTQYLDLEVGVSIGYVRVNELVTRNKRHFRCRRFDTRRLSGEAGREKLK